jgi:glycyl-tRNA synthetase
VTTDKSQQDLLPKLVSLCKRRGIIFQSSEIYGGLRSAYDYGPLGVELKRNIAAIWWRDMVHARQDIVGIDASIMMHPKVWQTSGHLAGFSDPLVDCRDCKERFRADKAPRAEPGSTVSFSTKQDGKDVTVEAQVLERGYVCPVCGSPRLSEERQFNLMFRTSLGPVDPLESLVQELHSHTLSREDLRVRLDEIIRESAVYLRPETAQAMFVQFLNVQQTQSMKVPFGIAQIGKSFRNEITSEKFIFRTCEFEQMEMEYFIEPGSQDEWLTYWKNERLSWWRRYANDSGRFRLRQHESDELAHYSTDCYDIEFLYPWGWDELEGVASRTDYDLTKHSSESGVKLSYFDQQKNDPVSGKPGWKYTPYVIEPAAGLTRAVLAYLVDAFAEEGGTTATGEDKTRTLLKLHPQIAPLKAAILPLVKKDGLAEAARDIATQFFKAGINVRCDEQQSIGKRYARHDEVGTPYCITIDHQTLEDETVTIRDRDTTVQERISVLEALKVVEERIRGA